MTISVGLLGSAFMGRAHSRALHLLQALEDEPAALPRLAVICGRDPERRAAMQRRYGWERGVADWRELVADPEVQLFVNASPNHLHAEPSVEAARAGKAVLCEKPLGRDAAEARRMLEAVEAAGVVHMCAFNYRFFPSVRLAHELIRAGEIGRVRHLRSQFLLSSREPDQGDSWRSDREQAGSGVVGDLLAHHIDLARHLVGDIATVSAVTRAWPADGEPEGEIDDSVVSVVEFAGGAIGTLEATRSTPGHVITSRVQVDGDRGSIAFDLRRLNELEISDLDGRRTIDVTEAFHPYIDLWWPRGQGLGWGDSFVHELRHAVGAAAGAWPVAPYGATFVDGVRCAEVCDAVLEAARTGVRQSVVG